eukprot:1006562-Rhodomonas_salina.1
MAGCAWPRRSQPRAAGLSRSMVLQSGAGAPLLQLSSACAKPREKTVVSALPGDACEGNSEGRSYLKVERFKLAMDTASVTAQTTQNPGPAPHGARAPT